MTADERAYCENWCKAHVKTWQVLNRSQWQYTFHPKALVRYVEEVRQTEAEICLILEYLASDDCIATLSLYDQGVSGSWKPIRAWLETSNKSVQGVRSVRLYHGLQWIVAHEDTWYVIEDSCSQKVSVKYYWNAESVISVIGMSSSGVTVRIAGLQRDPETGLFNYMLEKIERKQQDLPEYTSGTTVYEDTKEEVHLGVKAGASAGKQASVNNGTIVRRKESKNADCTHNVENTTVVEKKVEKASETTSVALTGETITTVNKNMPSKASTANLDIGDSVENTETEGGLWNQVIRKVTKKILHLSDTCRKTVFAHTHSKSDVQGTKPDFTHVDEASGGVITSKSVSRTSDGGYKIDEDVTTEQPVTGAAVGWHKTLRGTTKTQVDRAQQNPVTSGGMRVGETRRSEKTEGGLWNNTNEVFDGTPAGELGEACERTTLEHTHSTTTNVADKPTVETSAGVNVRRSVSAQRTEVDTWDKTERVTTFEPKEKPYDGGGSVMRREHTTIGLNQTAVPDAGEIDVNVDVSVDASLNDHGSMTTHKRVTTFKEKRTGDVTVEHNESTDTVRSVSTKSARNIEHEGDAADFATRGGTVGKNEEVNFGVSMNEHGSFDVHTTKTTFRPVKTNEVTVSHPDTTDVVKDTRTKFGRNIETESEAKDFAVSNGQVRKNEELDYNISLNGHGTFDVHTHKKTFRPVKTSDITLTHSEPNDPVKSASTKFGRNIETEGDAKDFATRGSGNVGKNEEIDYSVSLNGHGTFDVNTKKVEFKKVETSEIELSRTGQNKTIEKTSTKIGRNLESEGAVKSFAGSTVGVNEDVSVSEMLNGHGTFDARVSKVKYAPWESQEKTWHDRKWFYRVQEFKNKTTIPSVDQNQDNASISFHNNGHGSFDGTIRYANVYLAQGDTLQVETTKSGLEADYVYPNKTGQMVCRHITYSKTFLFGRVQAVMEKLSGGSDLPIMGWRTGMSIRDVNTAYGWKYTEIDVGEEETWPRSSSNNGGS